jgi:uncharacterized protein YjbJ (UPF0337 family)
MDKDRIKGKVDEVAGRAKRQVGEWTGDDKAQGEGAMDEVKGKVENAWGKVKDGARDLKDDIEHKSHEADRKIDKKDRDVA